MPGMDEVLAARRAARASRPQGRANVVAFAILLFSIVIGILRTASSKNPAWIFIWVVVGVFFSQSPKIAKQWERAVVLRLGKYTGLGRALLFLLSPVGGTILVFTDPPR